MLTQHLGKCVYKTGHCNRSVIGISLNYLWPNAIVWMCAILSVVISYFVVRRDPFYDVYVFTELYGSIITKPKCSC